MQENKETVTEIRDFSTGIGLTPEEEETQNLTNNTKAKIQPKVANVKYLWIPLITSFVGTYNAFLITSFEKWDDSVLFKFINGLCDNMLGFIWICRILLIVNIVFFEGVQVRLLIKNLKELGASIMAITVYICNFGWGNFASYINDGKLPTWRQFGGMLLMILGVVHLCQFGIVYFIKKIVECQRTNPYDVNIELSYDELEESHEKFNTDYLRPKDLKKVFTLNDKSSEENSTIVRYSIKP